MKRLLLKFVGLLVVLAVGGFLVAASGVVPIKASSGHWPITAWFLNFSMRRSVVTHTIGMKVPPLDDPALVLKGAGHYETACRPCHGSPELHHPRIASAMTPHPPYLPPHIPTWEDEELFYIVKHGVKFTGMPAWPTQQRDDEVWAMVAFLRRFPELSATEYERLVQGGVSADDEGDAPIQDLLEPRTGAPAAIESCARCHGAEGLGRGTGAFPKLAGQSRAYLDASLDAYARGDRHSGIMEPLAAGLGQDEIAEIAEYYAGLESASAQSAQEEDVPESVREAIARGEAIARRGIPDQRVPACVACHGPADQAKNPVYPSLAGQYADYLVLQLELFAKGHRGGTPYAHLMREVAPRLKPEQMRDVALYYESLPLFPDNSPPTE